MNIAPPVNNLIVFYIEGNYTTLTIVMMFWLKNSYQCHSLQERYNQCMNSKQRWEFLSRTLTKFERGSTLPARRKEILELKLQ